MKGETCLPRSEPKIWKEQGTCTFMKGDGLIHTNPPTRNHQKNWTKYPML